nr:hypothetical protein GCM10020092_042330 [Actinoplanes digitatis]
MDIGVVLQCDPPAMDVVEWAKKAEDLGYSHVWTFDSHVLWQEPFVIYSKILADTRRVIVGPMVTNPGTRDWTVIASQFATLNEMYGNRTICGIGRGDSALRVLGLQPDTLARMRESIGVIKGLASGETVSLRGQELQFAWAPESRLDVWVAAYGPKALAVAERGRRRLHPATGRPGHRGLDDQDGPGGRRTGGPRPGRRQVLRRGAGLRRRRHRAPARADPVVRRHGRQPRRRHRRALRRDRRRAAGAHRLHQGPGRLRLRRARPG